MQLVGDVWTASVIPEEPDIFAPLDVNGGPKLYGQRRKLASFSVKISCMITVL
jgi:hypothetical protein